METTKLFALAIALLFLSISISGQDKPLKPGLDEYLASAKTIVIAECLRIGPINILMQADVDVRILLVLKGKETLREISVRSQYGMQPGKRYLLKTNNEATADGSYFLTRERDSVIEVSEGEKIEEIKLLSPRIIVQRTMNMRIYRLESQIRSLTYELESLDAARKEN